MSKIAQILYNRPGAFPSFALWLMMMVFQFLVIAIFVILSIRGILGGMGAGTLFSFDPFATKGGSMSFVLAGAAIACYSFLGFDAITTFTEETFNPKKTVPRAIILITLIGGAIFIVSSYFTQLVHPGFTNFKDVDSEYTYKRIRLRETLSPSAHNCMP